MLTKTVAAAPSTTTERTMTEPASTEAGSSPMTILGAEAISVVTSGIALATHFGDGAMTAADLASGMVGAIVKDPVQDTVVFKEYLETVMKERDGWKDLYRACRAQLP